MGSDPHLLPLAAQAGDDLLQARGAGVVAGYGRGDHDFDARPEALRWLGHRRLAALAAEEAAIQAAQRHGHHGHGPALENLLDALLELVELAVLRELALGEDADDLAVGELGVDLVEGLLQCRRIFVARRDGNGARGAEDEAHDRDLEDVVVHDEAHRPAHAAADDQRIHEAHVVADDEHGSGLGNVLEAAHLDAVHDVDEHPGQEAHQELGHQRIDVRRHDGIQHRRQDEELRDGEVQHFEPDDG